MKERINYQDIIIEAARATGIIDDWIFIGNHKITINNNSIVFTWNNSFNKGIFYHSNSGVYHITTKEEVMQIIKKRQAENYV